MQYTTSPDCVRPRLRPLNRGHRAGPEAFPGGSGDGGTRGAAQSGQRWAARDCRPRVEVSRAAHGCRFLSGWAMRLFRGKSLPEVQEITFEIGMLGKYGLDTMIPWRATFCGRCRGGPSRRWSCCASCSARLAEDRAGDEYRGGSGRGVGDGGEAGI